MRWHVVDRDGHYVVGPFLRRSNAESEAEVLNEEGLEELRPYTVEEA